MDHSMDTLDRNKKDLGLYIHIPFCVKKCDYCDFLSGPATAEERKKYFEALLTEIQSYEGCFRDYKVSTIFFGGGTPSCVEGSYIKEVMDLMDKVFRIDYDGLEATIEVNPGTISADKLKTYQRAGINRLSFGLQSAQDQELQLLGRIHNFKDFQENYSLARKLGFDNINIDLMSALPEQTLSSWESTLETVAKLNPEHISAYSLIIEEGTIFHNNYGKGAPDEKRLPEEEEDRKMYCQTKKILEEFGYHRYEISNYAKVGYECRHNSSYWVGTDYLGLGLGSASLVEGKRFSNISDRKQYIEKMNEAKDKLLKNKDDNHYKKDNPLGIRTNIEKLTIQQQMEEFMFLGLRLSKGVSQKEFLRRFGTELDSIYGKILSQLKEKKLLERKDDQIWLTDYGIDISNMVLSEFLLDM